MNRRFVGVIILLLQVATKRYGRENNIILTEGNFLDGTIPVTDFVLASGSLNYQHDDNRFVYRALKILFATCRIGLGFNLLSGEI